MNLRVLALDLGTSCGWAVTPAESGVWDLSRNRFEGGGMLYLRFRTKLAEVLDTGIQQVAYEEVRRHLGVDAAHAYGGFQGVLTEECERRKIPYRSIPVAEIKRHATGRGGGKGADKDAMVAAAKARWPIVVDDNHADALHLLDHVLSCERGCITPRIIPIKKRKVAPS